jgi:hypothetical protein
MQATVKELIQDSLTMLMVYSPDTVLTALESNTAIRALNGLIESLNNENLIINAVTKEDFTLVGGQDAYTWGTGGDFNSARPTVIKACTAAVTSVSGNVDFPVPIIQYDSYAVIKMKTLQTNYPQYVYADGGYPLNTLYFYPVPSSAVPVTIYSYKSLPEFTNSSDPIVFPTGYYRMFVALLAIELAPSYQVAASQSIIDIATQAKQNVMLTNKKILTMQTDPALVGHGGRYNIFSDKSGGQ